jgi:ribosomal protein L24
MLHVSPDIKVGGRIGSPSARHSIHNNISVTLNTSEVETSKEPAILATPPNLEASPLQVSKFDGVLYRGECEPSDNVIIIDNVDLLRCPVKNDMHDDFIIDVKFLKHVINVILTNHHITTDTNDLRDILNYYGEVDMRTTKEVVKTRGVKKRLLCGNVDTEDVIEIVQKVLVNGVNIAKRVPDLVDYVQKLGVNL